MKTATCEVSAQVQSSSDFRLTVTLNRIMSDTTEHGELARLVQSESLPHPGEEVSEGEVTSSHSLGDSGRSRGERKCSDRVGSERDVEGLTLELLSISKDIGRSGVGRGIRSEKEARGSELKSGHLDADG